MTPADSGFIRAEPGCLEIFVTQSERGDFNPKDPPKAAPPAATPKP